MEHLRNRDIIIIGVVVLILVMVLLPRPITGSQYASDWQQWFAYYLMFVLLGYIVFAIYWFGYQRGIKKYRPPEDEYLSEQHIKLIEAQLRAGEDVVILAKDKYDKLKQGD